MSTKTAVHFGAGKIGRGFIGLLLAQSNYRVTFVDIVKDLIDEIQRRGSYTVHILDQKVSEIRVNDVNAILSTNTNEVVRALADPELRLITTSVGVNVLPKVAPTIAAGIKARKGAGLGPINVIACENTVGATMQLAEAIKGHLSEEEIAYATQNVGFANCSVDRIVPDFNNGDMLAVGVENFYEWIVDKEALKFPGGSGSLAVEGMTLTSNLFGYIERKLYTFNTAHCITAYLGSLRSHTTIYQAIADPSITPVVRGAMDESGAALRKKYPFFTEEAHKEYKQSILNRIENKNLDDTVARVGREPLRKLGKSDRLVGPTTMASKHGFPIDNLARGIAAALLYENAGDEQAVELKKKIAKQGVQGVVEELTGFTEGSKEYSQILAAYQELVKQKPGLLN